jgi:hypothetical protein
MKASSHYEIPFDQNEVFKRICVGFPALFNASNGYQIGVAIRNLSTKSLQCLFGYGLPLNFMMQQLEDELRENFRNEELYRLEMQPMQSILYFAATDFFATPTFRLLEKIAKKIDPDYFDRVWALRGEFTESPVRRFDEEHLRIVTFHRALENAYSPEWAARQMPVVMQLMLYRSGLIDMACMNAQAKKKLLSIDFSI